MYWLHCRRAFEDQTWRTVGRWRRSRALFIFLRDKRRLRRQHTTYKTCQKGCLWRRYVFCGLWWFCSKEENCRVVGIVGEWGHLWSTLLQEFQRTPLFWIGRGRGPCCQLLWRQHRRVLSCQFFLLLISPCYPFTFLRLQNVGPAGTRIFPVVFPWGHG